jgi:hypothetical protein
MASYWTTHKHEIIVWSIVGVIMLIFLFWYLHPKAVPYVMPPTPVIRPQSDPIIDNVELAPLPRVLLHAPISSSMLQLPLYENRDRDLWVPDYVELEEQGGYFYPKGLRMTRDVAENDN